MCTICGRGWYQPYEGSAECLRCAHPTSSEAGSSVCDICAEDTYRVHAALAPSVSNCRACPISFQCGFNTTLETVYVRPGFWRLSERASQAYACDGGADGPCVGGSIAGDLGRGYCANNSVRLLRSTNAHPYARKYITPFTRTRAAPMVTDGCTMRSVQWWRANVLRRRQLR
jgi:transcription elongation factor Elf1